VKIVTLPLISEQFLHSSSKVEQNPNLCYTFNLPSVCFLLSEPAISMPGKIYAYKILFGKPERNEELGRNKRKWNNSIVA